MESPTFSQAYQGATSAAQHGAAEVADVIAYPAILFFLIFIFWLVSREIRVSSSRSQDSEKGLEQERDFLEKRVAERTKELVDAEEKWMRELQRNADFGSLAQGLFHDLMSPLASLSLYIENMASGRSKPEESREIMGNTVDISKRMKSFMDSVKQNLSADARSSRLSVADALEELSVARDILMYKARMADVAIRIECPEGISFSAHPVRIQQMFLNLISNAIDACADAYARRLKPGPRYVSVHIARNNGGVNIEVADNGCGIPKERMDDVFSKTFTNKENGTGMGLGIVRSIVETDLKGTIAVESAENEGTTFTIKVPSSAARSEIE
jgi:two-component system C4-dicarboxylate transport sensor histidine kinase DctB